MSERTFSSVCLLLAVMFASMSAGFGKAAALALPRFDTVSIATSPFYALSIACVAMQAIVWPLALRQYPLSVAYMAMSLVYVNLLVIARVIFDESLTGPNLVGATLIIVGNALIARGRVD